MIIESVQLNVSRRAKITYIPNVGITDVPADSRRRHLRLVMPLDQASPGALMTGSVTISINPQGPQVSVAILCVNAFHPIDDMDIETFGELVTREFKFSSGVGGVNGVLIEILSP